MRVYHPLLDFFPKNSGYWGHRMLFSWSSAVLQEHRKYPPPFCWGSYAPQNEPSHNLYYSLRTSFYKTDNPTNCNTLEPHTSPTPPRWNFHTSSPTTYQMQSPPPPLEGLVAIPRLESQPNLHLLNPQHPTLNNQSPPLPSGESQRAKMPLLPHW